MGAAIHRGVEVMTPGRHKGAILVKNVAIDEGSKCEGVDLGWERQTSHSSGKSVTSLNFIADDFQRAISNQSKASVHSIAQSIAESLCCWMEAEQTLVFLDWDDTLFPTTALFERWKVPVQAERWQSHKFTEQQESLLESWREAVHLYLTCVCTVSKRVVILTNAKVGWVQSTIDCFAPRLNEILSRVDGPRVVYASEALKKCERGRCVALSRGLAPACNASTELSAAEAEFQLTRAKCAAMRLEATQFYSQYPGQTWKNIVSVGDAMYEYAAAQDLAFRRKGPKRENLRLKCIKTPEAPTLRDMTYHLNLAALLLRAIITYDGDIDMDMNKPKFLSAVVQALHMPELEALIREFPIPKTDQNTLTEELAQIAILLQSRPMDHQIGA